MMDKEDLITCIDIGVCKSITSIIGFCGLLVLICLITFGGFLIDKIKEVSIHTDKLTGYQYLSKGGLTPRIGKDGEHMRVDLTIENKER